MPLFETIEIDLESIKSIVGEHWKGVEIGDLIKSSQNHTYNATKKNSDGGDEKYVLRVTPDPKNIRAESTKLEVKFVEYMYNHQLPGCNIIKSDKTSEAMVRVNDTILVLFTFVSGTPIVYTEWKWMEREVVVGLGKWFARHHQLSKQFSIDHPECVALARNWRTLHDGVLKDVVVAKEDEESSKDPKQFGIIHGDVNSSNYFFDATLGMPTMFDWDQLQHSWFNYDLSTPLWGVYVLEKSGSPIDKSPVPGANSKQYTEWLLEGYQSSGDRVTVDQAALARMVEIRRQLYVNFCRRAITEVSSDHPMYAFCAHMVSLFDHSGI